MNKFCNLVFAALLPLSFYACDNEPEPPAQEVVKCAPVVEGVYTFSLAKFEEANDKHNCRESTSWQAPFGKRYDGNVEFDDECKGTTDLLDGDYCPKNFSYSCDVPSQGLHVEVNCTLDRVEDNIAEGTCKVDGTYASWGGEREVLDCSYVIDIVKAVE